MTQRLIGLTLLFVGFGACFFGRPGLLVAMLAWVLGTMMFAKSFVE